MNDLTPTVILYMADLTLIWPCMSDLTPTRLWSDTYYHTLHDWCDTSPIWHLLSDSIWPTHSTYTIWYLHQALHERSTRSDTCNQTLHHWSDTKLILHAKSGTCPICRLLSDGRWPIWHVLDATWPICHLSESNLTLIKLVMSDLTPIRLRSDTY